mgnify:CR=1 FL=1
MENRPRGREKFVTDGNGSGVNRRGSGLGSGPVGSGGGGGRRSGGGGGKMGAGGIVAIIIAVIFKLFFSSGEDGESVATLSGQSYHAATGNGVQTSYEKIDDTVSSQARSKFTHLAGGGRDDVTILVYMCGTDLESKSAMASNDLAEMTKADLGRVNLLVYTGGCKKWQTSGISASQNQIYKIEDGKIKRLEANAGKGAMTDPKTLSSFIKWGAKNYPATRYGLIFWDHGGGSVSGFGYDEKFSNGSMTLPQINDALVAGKIKFDFIGFDACLMATAETALMLEKHADYLIASEETEPGIGWYYTNWLSELGRSPSLSTLQIGKRISDDFIAECSRRCPGQKTTLSVVDLAEAGATLKKPLSDFADSLSKKIIQKEYKAVSDARYRTREFAQSSKIDQIDLVDLCVNAGGSAANELKKAVKSAVKYNRSTVTDAHGLSIFFPYRSARNVDKACEAYKKIGLDDSYSKCIKEFAGMEVSGQAAQGGQGSSLQSLLGNLAGSAIESAGGDAVSQLLGAFLQNAGSGLISGLTSANSSFLSDRKTSNESTSSYIVQNKLDSSHLVWKKSGNNYALSLSEKEWSLVHSLDKAMFYDDGAGFVALGFDNTFDYDREGRLLADTDKNWLALDGQVVSYYHLSTEEWTEGGKEKYKIVGRVPALLNKERVNLILVFTDENPRGFVAGAETDYQGKTEVAAKNLNSLKKGDRLDFLCDYYTYSGAYNDSFFLGEPMTVKGSPQVSNVDVGSGKVKIVYRFTDIYEQEYWSQSISK